MEFLKYGGIALAALGGLAGAAAQCAFGTCRACACRYYNPLYGGTYSG